MRIAALTKHRPRESEYAAAEVGNVGTLLGRFTEPEDFAAALQGGEFEYLRLPDQPFQSGNRRTLRTLRMADVLLQQADDGPHIARGTIAPGLAALILPLARSGETVSVNGSGLYARQAIVLPGGADFTAICTKRQDWAAVALPIPLLECWEELAPAPLLRRRDVGVLTLMPEGAARLAGIFETAGSMVDEPERTTGIGSAAAGLARSFIDTLCSVLANGSSIVPRSRACREAHRVVRVADEFLRANVGRPIYREELCDALGISLRKLHDAFRAVTGLTPQTYLKTRRLTLVRHALRTGGDAPTLVKSVALAHGFWHLGNFAQDYKALFGETPSYTLASRSGAERSR